MNLDLKTGAGSCSVSASRCESGRLQMRREVKLGERRIADAGGTKGGPRE